MAEDVRESVQRHAVSLSAWMAKEVHPVLRAALDVVASERPADPLGTLIDVLREGSSPRAREGTGPEGELAHMPIRAYLEETVNPALIDAVEKCADAWRSGE